MFQEQSVMHARKLVNIALAKQDNICFGSKMFFT